MNAQTRLEIRSGLAALVVTGLLFTLGVAIRGPIDPDPASLLRTLHPNFVPGAVIGMVGGLFQIYGLFGLYRYLTYQRQSLIGLLAVVLSQLGIVLVLPLAAFLAVHVPVMAQLYQQGNDAMVIVFQSNFSGFGLVLLGASSVTGVIGAILFAVVIWQNRRLPRWLGPLYALSAILVGLLGGRVSL